MVGTQLAKRLHEDDQLDQTRDAMGEGALSAEHAAVKERKSVGVFSLEMSKSEITMRLLSAEAKIPLNHMRNGKMSDDDWHTVIETNLSSVFYTCRAAVRGMPLVAFSMFAA